MTVLDAYCLDASVFINGWRKHYPPAVFPTLWSQIDEHIGHDRIWSCEAVLRELQKQKDELFEWAKVRRKMFITTHPGTIGCVRQIMEAFPNFAAMGGSSNAADPWLIAEAMASGHTVVTTEEPSRNKPRPTRPPKIPDVCDALRVPWTTPVDFFARLGICV